MKVVLSWLREFAPFPDDVDRLADALADLGLPVEGLQRTGGVAGVVTARVLRTEAHPDASKVQRVWIDAGDGGEHHVWCGAFNFGAGDLVPFAPVGTALPDGRVLTSRAILGIPSEGMLCSAQELALGTDHSGIMVLPETATVGAPYGEAIGLVADVVFDVDVTRNRPDCHGHLGVARDLAAWLDLPITVPEPTVATSGPERSAPVDIVAGDSCARFTTVVLSGVRVAPSAPWMATRLLAAGQRPINNVVDVSNYVMLELNQPNHAYDLDTLGGGGVRVRHATAGERLTTLDGVDRPLTGADVLICDAHDVPIGLAGIMGGADTEITDATSTVALECAWFEPYGIAATMTRTGLRTDASSRFERGVDPYGIDRGVARFIELLGETCPQLVVHAGAVDARTDALPARERRCAVRVANVNRILGTDLAAADLPPLLDPIGYTVEGDGAVVEVALPSWRPDSTEEIDVIEEVARHYGYANIVTRVPQSPLHGHLSERQQRRRRLRQVLVGLGASEVMPSPFLSAEMVADAGIEGEVLHIANPLVADEDVLRPSLRPGLLRAVAFNESHRRPAAWLFELGHVYRPAAGDLPDEREMLGLVLAGEEAPAAMTAWREIAAAMSIGARVDQTEVPAGLHPTRSATLVAGRERIGAVGEVAPAVLAALGIDERVAVLEIDLDVALANEPKPARWKPTGRHPSSDLDLAFVLPDDVPAERLDKAIRQGAGKLLVGLVPFDRYRGPGVPDGTRSLGFRLRLQAPDRTLTDTDVASVVTAVTAAASKLGAQLRG